MDCPHTAALEQYLLGLSPDQQIQLLRALESGNHAALLKANGVDIDSCDYLALLQLVRRHFASIADDDLVALSGGEVKVTLAIGSVVIGGAAALAVGIGVGVDHSLG